MRVQRFDDRKEKLYFGEKIFFLDVCSPQRKVDCFGMIHQWGTQNWCYKQKWKFRKTVFLGKGVSPKTFLNDIVINVGYGRPMLERKEFISENFFHRKAFHIKISDWFSMIYQRGYTRMMMEIKITFRFFFFSRRCLFKKMFWLILLLVGLQSNKVIWRKTFLRRYFYRQRK